eukprot:CAMPEP_0173140268 /NCGR_PEP_ID=MMETSP1105-20130129/4776_1 /TAXON_ID=2985 /ORGANISM="Ochromonas sp., Strain BG-1" /LENGTH=429 /DNA_ID=CAMNT_0014053205 /DNA_START=68 /DNA_END=1357 /DNA_ORIENTATION=-
MDVTGQTSFNNPQETYTEEERSLFLGDLSCFCQEQDIFQFFQGCGEIESIRLMRSKTTNKCLGYGFITFVDLHVLPIAMKLYGRVLLGRRVKIGLANPRKVSPVSAKIAALMREFDRARLNTKDSNTTTAQVHFSYLTQQTHILITEETIRGIFSQFGEVDDVTIKKSSMDAHSQHGYGFVHFYLNDDGIDAAIRATSVVRQITVDGVLYDSCLTRSLEAVLHTPSAPNGSSSAPRYGQTSRGSGRKGPGSSLPPFVQHVSNMPSAPSQMSYPSNNSLNYSSNMSYSTRNFGDQPQFSTYSVPSFPNNENYYAQQQQPPSASNFASYTDSYYNSPPAGHHAPPLSLESPSFSTYRELGPPIVAPSSSTSTDSSFFFSPSTATTTTTNVQPQTTQEPLLDGLLTRWNEITPSSHSDLNENPSFMIHPFTH